MKFLKMSCLNYFVLLLFLSSFGQAEQTIDYNNLPRRWANEKKVIVTFDKPLNKSNDVITSDKNIDFIFSCNGHLSPDGFTPSIIEVTLKEGVTALKTFRIGMNGNAQCLGLREQLSNLKDRERISLLLEGSRVVMIDSNIEGWQTPQDTLTLQEPKL